MKRACEWADMDYPERMSSIGSQGVEVARTHVVLSVLVLGKETSMVGCPRFMRTSREVPPSCSMQFGFFIRIDVS